MSSKLTCLKELPKLDRRSVGPHRYRALGDKVLVTGDAGHYAFLSPGEYRAYLRGMDEGHPRFEELRLKGFIRHYMEFDLIASEALESSLLSWEGAKNHVVFLERGGVRMDPDTAREAVDFIFTVPGPVVQIEMVAGDVDACWPAVWLLVRYARRRAEWNSRLLRLWLRTGPEGPEPKKLKFLLDHSVGLRVAFDGAAGPGRKPAWRRKVSEARRRAEDMPMPRALLRVAARTTRPRAWVEHWKSLGCGSVRLAPSPELLDEGRLEPFLDFYARALDRMIAEPEPALREEWAAAFLRRVPPEAHLPREERGGPLPGHDVVGELAYSPEGGIFTNSNGLDLARKDMPVFKLGIVEKTAYEEFPDKDLVRLSLAALEGAHQPLCFHCAYKPYCAVAPSQNMLAQGSFWGQIPSSPHCAAQMGVLDILFERLKRPRSREVLLEWTHQWSYL
ncbi:MAG: hypothetical protein ABII00_02440 [Elusimicrobiota bacterium]